jgi:hypothetical protein
MMIFSFPPATNSKRLKPFLLVVAARFPHGVLDLLLAFGAQVLSEAFPVEHRETAPKMAFQPVLGRLNLSSAHYARIHR